MLHHITGPVVGISFAPRPLHKSCFPARIEAVGGHAREIVDRHAVEELHGEDALAGKVIVGQRDGDPREVDLLEEQPVAGMVELGAADGETPSYWMPYFAVDDCDAAVAKAEGLGASLVAGPMGP